MRFENKLKYRHIIAKMQFVWKPGKTYNLIEFSIKTPKNSYPEALAARNRERYSLGLEP